MFNASFIDLFTADYWYDFGFQQSAHTLQRFSNEEWAELLANWRTQPLEWQDRLAYILGDGETTREYELLMVMYRLAAQEVRLTAAENLRALSLSDVVNTLPISEATRMKTELAEKLNVNAVLTWVAARTGECGLEQTRFAATPSMLYLK